MTGETKTRDSGSEDIDLLLLIEGAILFFKRYRWIFFIAILAGLISGLSVYRHLPTVYKSRLIAHSYLLTNQEEIQIIETWNEQLSKHEYSSVAELFNTDEKLVSKVKLIKADEIQKVFTPNNPNGFTIEVTVTDTAILRELQKAIVYGMENNDFCRIRIKMKRANLRELVDKTNEEILQFDSTKKKMERILNGNDKPSSLSIIDMTGLSKQRIEMNEKLINYRQELQLSSAIQVLQGFSLFHSPSGPKLLVWLFLGVVPFVCLAWLYAVIHSIHGKLKHRRLQINFRT